MRETDDDLKAAEEMAYHWIHRNETEDADGDIREYHLAKAYLAGLAAGREQEKWIGEAEMLPEDGQEVVAVVKNKWVGFGTFSRGRDGNPRWTICQPTMLGTIDPEVYGASVTHWMPIPDAPKGPEGES